MRFKNWQIGEKRRRTEFLLFPKTIGGQTRWMEVATWEEELMESLDSHYWKGIAWLDE